RSTGPVRSSVTGEIRLDFRDSCPACFAAPGWGKGRELGLVDQRLRDAFSAAADSGGLGGRDRGLENP
ncbi:MAG: hypothetical protein LBK95_03225, partial [Bifidobacteriaceae bacterium]|nr:hypothetical protein [Bifidobacteriaceae bacterium]